jgi:1-aminocyclopropane-1-carboxylate deaminase/D-cysteine desulfhydrase-like pyridoxal-dependent ACC family enzyme
MSEHPAIEAIRRLPRINLLAAPTLLEPWMRVSQRLEIELFVKRDDLIGIGAGGNKLRKLDLILGNTVEDGVTWLLTTGGVQSNHARLTAAAAAKLGLRCTLHLRGEARSDNGNVLLDHLFGAEVRLHGPAEYPVVYERMSEHAGDLRTRGETPLLIPLGGATAHGTAAYVAAFAEILADCEGQKFRPDVVLVAAGTASTFAGLELGARLLAPKTDVIGISVSWSKDRLIEECDKLIRDTCVLLNVPTPPRREAHFDSGYIGPGYAQISEAGLREVVAVAREQGVLCDTTYTGKALAGLAGLCANGRIPRGAKVVFVHTGGVPELFTRSALELGLC